jgi:flavodoxin I
MDFNSDKMKNTAIIYSFNSLKTKKVAEKITEEFGDNHPVSLNAETISGDTFLSYDRLILGVPTWFDGELPNYWDEFVPELEDLNLEGKDFAIFGLGDQKGYPENFADGIGLMVSILEKRGARIVGFTPCEGYYFESSKALRDNKFLGLVIDQENQARLTSARIKEWVNNLKKEGF